MTGEQQGSYAIAGMSFRQLIARDAPVAFALQKQVMDGMQDPTWFIPSDLAEWQEICALGEAFGYFARGKLMGVANLTPALSRPDHSYAGMLGQPMENTLDVRNVLVHEKARRRGIQSNLLRLFDEIARASGGTKLYATIALENIPSVRGFEKAGYRHCGTLSFPQGWVRGFFCKELTSRSEK